MEKYRGIEQILIEKYILMGPKVFKHELDLSDEEFDKLFDYLVFEHNLLYKAVLSNLDFFLKEYIAHGMTHLRDIFEVSDEKFDRIWESVFDLLAVSHNGVYQHVYHHRERYVTAFRARGGDFVRTVLGLRKDKYLSEWEEILNLLLHSTCNMIFSENTMEQGLRAFSLLMNGVREHRPVFKHKLF